MMGNLFNVKLSFAKWLLFSLITMNLAGGALVVLNTARTEGAAIKQERRDNLEQTTNSLHAALQHVFGEFGANKRGQVLSDLYPVLYANSALDIMGLYRAEGGWEDSAWTRAGGEGTLPNLLPKDFMERVTTEKSVLVEYKNHFIHVRPIIEPRRGSEETRTASYLIVGQDRNVTMSALTPRMTKLATQLGLVVLFQTLLVALFLDRRLRRPLARISDRTAEVEQENSELAAEFSNLDELSRIEKAVGLLGQSRTEYKTQEAHLRSVLATVKEGILVLDECANIVEVNQEFVSIWGYSPDEIVGQPVYKILDQRYWDEWEKDIERYRKTGVTKDTDSSYKLDALDTNGRVFPVEYSYSQCIVGKKRMFVATVRDISEQERYSEEILEAKEIAEQAAAAKAVFLANMSHEIRTPMNGVMGLLDLVGDTKLDPQQSAMIKTAKTSAESLLNVLNDILDISKIEAGKVDLESAEFDIKTVFEDVVTLFQIAAIDKRLELSCFVDPDIQNYLIGDSTRLRQILSNIVGNAVKFTTAGEIEVRLDVQARKKDQLDMKISIRDTGIGMSEAALGKLFQQFSQADESTTRKFGGTGLGMAISKQLTELMGGTIGATSKEGVGTEFNVHLSLPTGKKILSTITHRYSLLATHALIVDDNQTNREILGAYLSSWNITYRAASGAKEALELLKSAKESSFDICLTDYHMPEMDGVDLARAIKDSGCAPDMAVGMLSSGTIDIDIVKEVGIKHFLNKPIRQNELFELIASCLDIDLELNKEIVKLQEDFQGHVLLVEDNKVNQMVAKSLLEKLGLSVGLAIDGLEALDAMATTQYDLVFMDCLMPNMDGYEATTKRRIYEEENNLPRLPVVALTANAMSGDKEKCLDSGMDEFLSKPIRLDEIKEVLQRTLKPSKGAESNLLVSSTAS